MGGGVIFSISLPSGRMKLNNRVLYALKTLSGRVHNFPWAHCLVFSFMMTIFLSKFKGGRLISCRANAQ